MGVISWKLDIPTDLSICNNQGCVFLRVQLMIHLPWNFDTASENNISIISLPYSNQLRGILIDQREIWRHTYIKYPHLSPNYAFGITFEWFAGLKFMFSEKVTTFLFNFVACLLWIDLHLEFSFFFLVSLNARFWNTYIDI